MNGHTKRRQALWDAEVALSEAANLGSYPICNLCHQPVHPFNKWDESHDGTPKAFGGKIVGIAHTPCNRRHGASVVKPLVTKAKNVRARHTGAFRPRKPLPGGRDSDVKIQVGGGVVARIGLAEKMRETLEKRKIIPLLVAALLILSIGDGSAKSAYPYSATKPADARSSFARRTAVKQMKPLPTIKIHGRRPVPAPPLRPRYRGDFEHRPAFASPSAAGRCAILQASDPEDDMAFTLWAAYVDSARHATRAAWDKFDNQPVFFRMAKAALAICGGLVTSSARDEITAVKAVK